MNRPIRVLHCLSSITAGGVERRHLELVKRLPASRFSHRFLGTDAGGPIALALQDSGAAITTLGPVRSVFEPGRYRRGIAVAREWQPDLIHGAVMEGMVLAAVLGRRLGIPVIVEETSDPQNRRQMGHRLMKLATRSATSCVAVSPAVGRYLTDQLRVPPSKVHVIVNGVSRPAPLPVAEAVKLRANLGIPESGVVVGTVSRLWNDHKRVTDLIEAIRLLGSRHRDLHLVVVGSGPDRPLMERAARDSGYDQRIHFVGLQMPASPYYAIMDVFALASSREAFGLVAAEAMRAGLPVVASKVGGLGDIVLDGETGYLVPPFSPTELAAALERLIIDPESRCVMGHAGRARADRHYSVERYVGDVEQLYMQLLGMEPVESSQD